jgi:hypothetical protein
VPVELKTCKSGALTQDGSKYSNTRVSTLWIHLTTKSLMLLHLKTKKAKL